MSRKRAGNPVGLAIYYGTITIVLFIMVLYKPLKEYPVLFGCLFVAVLPFALWLTMRRNKIKEQESRKENQEKEQQ